METNLLEGKMIKLTKTNAAEWNGNGFGNNAAEWVVVGFENIAVRKLGINWFAVDTSEYAILNGRKVSKKVLLRYGMR